MLNHDSDEVAELAVSVLSHWLGRGASAWRLDAAYAVPPAFWARVLPRVRSEFPDAWFVGEVIHGDYAGIIERSSMDSLTQYELWKAMALPLAPGAHRAAPSSPVARGGPHRAHRPGEPAHGVRRRRDRGTAHPGPPSP